MRKRFLALSAATLSGAMMARAAEPAPNLPKAPPRLDPNVIQVQDQPLVGPGGATTGASGSSSLLDSLRAEVGGNKGSTPVAQDQGTSTAPRTDSAAASSSAPAGSAVTSVGGGGGAAGEALNAPDASDLLTKSITSTGVDIQRRNPIVADVRIRGLRSTQYNAYADGAWFIPSRLDLDSVISRFDPGSIRDILVIKGPYSAMYGPAFAYVDIGTLNSPRYDCLQVHGRTAIGYQTNGARWDGVQSILVGDTDWGFRITYNLLQGNDYVDGQGNNISSSYRANNVSYALGVDLSPVSSIEFKGFYVTQNDLEFPGYYFDINQLNSEAYNLRYTLNDQNLFDRFTADFWYNSTVATGNTALAPKQLFVDQLLATSFSQRQAGGVNSFQNPFQDNSITRFAGRSIGYRFAGSWGPKDAPLLTLGTDLNVFGQGLKENINFTQYPVPGVTNLNLNTLQPVTAPVNYIQNQGIPNSQSVNPGLFFETQYKLTDDYKVRLGGRYDYVATNAYQSRNITGNVNIFGTPGFPNGNTDTSINPIIYSVDPLNDVSSRQFNLGSGFLTNEYKVTDKITGVASFGYAMRAPTLTELYAGGPFIGVLQQGTSRLIGDPNLKSEKLYQVDLGLRAEYEMWSAGVNGFYAWINDYITYDANRLGQGLTQVVYTNTDLATLAGAELFGQVEATAWLTAFGTLSYVQGIDQTLRDNRRAANITSSRRDAPLIGQRVPATEALPGIPPLESRLGIRFHPCTKTPKWQIELSARVVTGQEDVAVTLGEFQTPGFTIFDIRTFWQVTDSWLLTAGVENVGNKQYREHLDPISGTVIGVNPLYRPGTNAYFGSQITY